MSKTYLRRIDISESGPNVRGPVSKNDVYILGSEMVKVRDINNKVETITLISEKGRVFSLTVKEFTDSAKHVSIEDYYPYMPVLYINRPGLFMDTDYRKDKIVARVRMRNNVTKILSFNSIKPRFKVWDGVDPELGMYYCYKETIVMVLSINKNREIQLLMRFKPTETATEEEFRIYARKLGVDDYEANMPIWFKGNRAIFLGHLPGIKPSEVVVQMENGKLEKAEAEDIEPRIDMC